MESRVWVVESPGGAFIEATLLHQGLAPNQVRVKIHASGINPLDAKIRAGQAAHAQQPLPAVLGVEMAGVVSEVGAGVTRFRTGDEVYGLVGGVGGLPGTAAEFLAVDADSLARKPRNLSMREAGGLPLAVITAWEGLVDRARVGPGQKVLIHAGAGGVGHVAVQIARAYGAEVFATVSPAKSALVQSYGATPIDYRASTAAQYVDAHTGGEGFDVIYDTVGGQTLDDSFASVRRYTGQVLSCLGWGSHSLAPLSFRGATYSGVFTLYPLLSGTGRAHQGEILARATALIEGGQLRPLLSKERFGPGEFAAAHARLGTGAPGRVVVELC